MAMRHAVLAALLDGEASGYQLSKLFNVGMADFWHAVPQQLYSELSRLEDAGLIKGREVVQENRPNKRVFTVTDAGRQELATFAATPAKPMFLRDDLLVKVYSADLIDTRLIADQLAERARQAEAKIERLDRVLERLRDGRDEQTFLAESPSRIGPYLTCMRGRIFEEEYLRWCTWAIELLRKLPAGLGITGEAGHS